jgi:formate dehydrogenase subunit beta
VRTEKGKKLLDTAKEARAITLTDAPPEGIALREKLDGIMGKMARKAMAAQFAQFDKCIGCRNFIEVCPICNCVECFTKEGFVVPKNELPPDPRFHLTRLLHVAPSCVNCGQCQDSCPMEILLAPITHMVQSLLKRR